MTASWSRDELIPSSPILPMTQILFLKLNLEISFIDAVNGSEISKEKLQAAANKWTRPIFSKDIGCYLSHRKAWEKVSKENKKCLVLEDDVKDTPYSNIVSYVNGRFERAKNKRYSDEERWIQAYRNYRGVYGPEVQFTETEKSRVFIKVTKTKVLAAFSQLCDVLFSQNRFPIGVEPTTLPEGVVDAAHIDPKKPAGMEEEPEMPDIPIV